MGGRAVARLPPKRNHRVVGYNTTRAARCANNGRHYAIDGGVGRDGAQPCFANQHFGRQPGSAQIFLQLER